MGQIAACACQGTAVSDSSTGQALLQAKIQKKKPQVTKIRNRISSIINPLKLPKFQESITPTTARLSYSKPPRKADKLLLISQDPDKSIVFEVPKQSSGTISFETGTESDIQKQFRVQADQDKDAFRMSVKYTDVVGSSGEEEGCFFMRDEAVGLGSFYRIQAKEMVPVVSSMLINVGNQFIVPYMNSTSVLNESNWDQNRVFELKVYGGCSNGQMIEISSSQQESVVTIGRSRANKLVLNDPLLSKIQCRFVRKNSKWFLVDGGDNQKESSTNGTWVYMGHMTKVKDGMELRCGSYYYTCSLQKEQQ